LFYENWESKEFLDQHLATEHLKSFLAKADDLQAAPPEIVIWDKISKYP
jgi:quinol monooxygenase YgiN